MDEFTAIPYLHEIIIILVAAGILVPFCNRFHLSPVLGYLAIGFIVGPFGLGALSKSPDDFFHYLTIDNMQGVTHLAEFGIVFLMFMIGLELSPQRLWAMRKLVFGLGALQVVVTGVILGGIAMLAGMSLNASVVIGAAMAMSSTAIVMQILIDRKLIATSVGRSSFAILLFQDIAVVPILILIGLLSTRNNEGAGAAIFLASLKAIGAISFLVIIGHYFLRPIFRLAGSVKAAEPFMAVTLLTVIVAAAVTGQAGLSMALGAFLGGLLLAETEYRHAIEVYIEPFKGLLLGLFFMSVGMGIDPHVIRLNAAQVGIAVLCVFLIKATIITALGLLFGLQKGNAVKSGMLLGQSGEFAFVVVGTSITANLLEAPTGQFLLIVASLSMAVTPVVALLARKLGWWLDRTPKGLPVSDAPSFIPEMSDHILIAGYGRVGKAVSAILDAEAIPYLAFDSDAVTITIQREEGKPVIYGDASHANFLKRCHPELAQAALVTIADAKISSQIIKALNEHWPALPVYTRARDLKAAKELRRAGSTVVVAETIEASLQLASSLLRGIGTSEEIVLRRMELSREYAMNRIEESEAG